MMQHHQQTENVKLTGGQFGNQTRHAESNRILPAALIFGAWLCGTLLFEISALDDVGSRSGGEHWGTHVTMLEKRAVGQTDRAPAILDLRTNGDVK